MIAAIITLGFGSFSSIAEVITLGFIAGPGGGGGGVGSIGGMGIGRLRRFGRRPR